jgi:regulator of sigma E protease
MMAEVVDLLWKIAGFVVALSILVCVHEYGHYWMARRLGVKVLRFSLGFGKPWKSFFTKDGVEWAIGPFPFGGYVKMLGEADGIVAPMDRPRAFRSQSVPRRLAILFAGPAANLILAVLLHWAILMLGVQGLKTVIAAPAAGTAAAKVGLQAGEQVLAVDGKPTVIWPDLRMELIDRSLDHGVMRLDVKAVDGSRRSVSIDLSTVRTDPEVLFDDLGLDVYQPPVPPIFGDIAPGSAAQNAGLARGDKVLTLDDAPIGDWAELVRAIRSRPGAVVRLGIDRGGQHLDVNAVLASEEDGGKRIGRLGAGPSVDGDLWQNLRAERRLGPMDAIPAAFSETWRVAQLTLRILYHMVIGEVSVKNISGPIQIAQVAGISAQIGLVPFLSFMAVVSISLGVLNLMPVPVLDGGSMLLFTIEGIKGRPLSERAQIAAQYVGFAFIGMLMVLALYNDIMRLV